MVSRRLASKSELKPEFGSYYVRDLRYCGITAYVFTCLQGFNWGSPSLVLQNQWGASIHLRNEGWTFRKSNRKHHRFWTGRN